MWSCWNIFDTKASTFYSSKLIRKRTYWKTNIQKCSHPVVLYTKGVSEIYSKLTGKQLCWSLKLQAWDLQLYYKRDCDSRWFSLNFAKFLRSLFHGTPAFENILFTCLYCVAKITSEVLAFLSENKIKESSNDNQIQTFFWNVFLLNVDIWHYFKLRTQYVWFL